MVAGQERIPPTTYAGEGEADDRGREDVEKEVQQEDEHEEKLYAEVSSYLLVLICPSPTLPSCSLACIFAAPLSRISVHHTPFDICTQLSFVKEGREHQYTTTGHHMRQYTHKCHILESRYNTANRCNRGYNAVLGRYIMVPRGGVLAQT